MNPRDERIIEKLIYETCIVSEILYGYDEARFLSDERTMRAICMTLINIGELVKVLSDNLKTEYPSVPWRKIAGMRDVAAHKYQTIRMKDVYLTCANDIPIFLKQLTAISRQS